MRKGKKRERDRNKLSREKRRREIRGGVWGGKWRAGHAITITRYGKNTVSRGGSVLYLVQYQYSQDIIVFYRV